MEAILTDAMFDLPSRGKTKKLTVDKEYAENKFNKAGISRLRVA